MASVTSTLLGKDEHANRTASEFALRLRRARLGMLVCVSAVAMIFVSYSSAYFVRQGLPTLDSRGQTLVHDWLPLQLPNFLLINTIVLLLSTFTMELARRQAIREAASAGSAALPSTSRSQSDGIPWLGLTAVLGLGFLAGQWLVWRELAARGFYLATNPSNSFFYLLTGTHGVHLLGGIVALLTASAATLFFRQSAASRGVMVDVTAWYWHFMTFLWVYLLCLMKFAR
jgi:cytochrome c oxidase subunit 3